MQSILFRRTLRQLKANLFRYLALLVLIIAAMGIVVGVVGSAESVIQTVNEKADENSLEDGQFSLFAPLTEEQKTDTKDLGFTLEECFSLDFSIEDGSTLRLMKNRKTLNRIETDSGRLAETENEIVLEHLYASAHNISVGDNITVGGQEFTVCGIGITADYDLCLQNKSDMSADGSVFGTAFVTETSYKMLLDSGKALHTEEYCYSYRIDANSSEAQLKDHLSELTIDPDEVSDVYFQEMIKRETQDRDKLTDGTSELADGSAAINDEINEINAGALEIQQGIQSAYEGLKQFYGGYDSSDSVPVPILEMFNQISTGAENLASGTQTLAENSETFFDGINTLQKETNELLDEYFPLKIDNLLEFIPAGDNPRIKAANDDVQININVGIMAGILVMILVAYVISVFTVHSIDQESPIIGTLYALGLKRKQLMLHYTLLPVVLCMLGGILGTAIGYSRFMLEQMAGDTFAYFSIPAIEPSRNPLLLLYGILLPPLAAFAVNWLTIRKRLNRTALSLLRKESKTKKNSRLVLTHMSFPRAFKLRQLLREKRSCFAILAGIFLSLLVLILGLNCYVLCHNVETNTVADTQYEYMYQMKYPESTVPEGGYEAYIEGLTKEVLGYEMEISIIGLTDDAPFFPSITSNRKNEISISSSVAQKYGLKQGDELILHDKLAETVYAFTVKEVVSYSPGLCAFMDIDSMRELFGQDSGYYNAVYADHALDIDAGRLYAVSSKADVKKSASIFLTTMTPLITTMIGASILIFLIVLYQMTKVMTDRSATSISLMKIFGYRSHEIRSLYLDGSFLLVTLGTLILLPLAKCLMDIIYPSFVANVACGTDFHWPPLLYAVVYFGTIFGYLIIRAALIRQLKKWTPAEILKNRE